MKRKEIFEEIVATLESAKEKAEEQSCQFDCQIAKFKLRKEEIDNIAETIEDAIEEFKKIKDELEEEETDESSTDKQGTEAG